jgi:hypothetical protein
VSALNCSATLLCGDVIKVIMVSNIIHQLYQTFQVHLPMLKQFLCLCVISLTCLRHSDFVSFIT